MEEKKYNNTISVREKICFDNDKYLKIEKEKILEILVKYNSQISSLHSSYSINGTGTTYVKIRNFKIREEKFSILAKMYSVFWMPMPYIIGYIVCRDKDKIISSFSKESFQKIKDEIQEKIENKKTKKL